MSRFRIDSLVAIVLVVPMLLGALLLSSAIAGPASPSGNGDVNGDGGIDIGDPVYLLSYLFSQGPAPIAIAGGGCECDTGMFRVENPSSDAAMVVFGSGDDRAIGIDPASAGGLILMHPGGVRIYPPDPIVPGPTQLLLGLDDDAAVGTDPAMAGLFVRNPGGLRIYPPDPIAPSTIRLGMTDLHTIGIDPAGPSGITLRDSDGIRVIDPTPAGTNHRIAFGPTNTSTIGLGGGPSPGMYFNDPSAFNFVGAPVFASAFIQQSSQRFKEEIRPLEGALARLRALEGVSYRRKDRPEARTEIGFVAESVAAVVPEVVSHDAEGNAIGIDYGRLVALAVAGIREQQSTIEALRLENRSLEQRLARLERLEGEPTDGE